MASPATLNADTLEQQLVEIIKRVRIKQLDTAKNPDGVSMITAMTRNEVSGLVTVSLSIPTIEAIDVTDGSIDYSALAPYLD
ncbi:conserved hypothetical protein [Planktothrix serta PCC 8927]|uniref:Uncharacterized protein n=1 Tax=Planktothrix serta PCC 8927 TaxID=671068 RepID=A0A7Z9BNX8_9CYAN|nr:hypothetical protein [Planktothrix serta]VXD15993.1 conserved hypothetical protein [Planktothrix serta PCC 8927]